jgi:hypothetical protein
MKSALVAIVGALAVLVASATGQTPSVFAPIDVRVPVPPRPFVAAGSTHLVYELHIMNLSSRPATLEGDHWLAANGPGNEPDHRRTLLSLNGEGRIAQRFAIDWVRLFEDGRTFRGDPQRNPAIAPLALTRWPLRTPSSSRRWMGFLGTCPTPSPVPSRLRRRRSAATIFCWSWGTGSTRSTRTSSREASG